MTLKALSITKCKECGSTALTRATSILNQSDVQNGLLRTSDVRCVFYLGCDECSETLAMVDADKLASEMNAQLAAVAESV